MDEKQKLELAAKAAKAAGLNVFEMGGTFLYKPYANHSIVHRWNPLTDDGDALRLAVKLEINVLPSMEQTSARNPSYTGWINEDASRDPYAATRLAIVRAAAAIGEQSNG